MPNLLFLIRFSFFRIALSSFESYSSNELLELINRHDFFIDLKERNYYLIFLAYEFVLWPLLLVICLFLLLSLLPFLFPSFCFIYFLVLFITYFWDVSIETLPSDTTFMETSLYLWSVFFILFFIWILSPFSSQMLVVEKEKFELASLLD